MWWHMAVIQPLEGMAAGLTGVPGQPGLDGESQPRQAFLV